MSTPTLSARDMFAVRSTDLSEAVAKIKLTAPQARDLRRIAHGLTATVTRPMLAKLTALGLITRTGKLTELGTAYVRRVR